MKPAIRIGLIVIVGILVVVGVLVFSAHRSRVAAREASLNSLNGTDQRVETLESRLEDLGAQYDEAMSAGSTAGQKRHDAAQNDGSDSKLLGYAKQESSAVAKADDLNDKINEIEADIAQEYQSRYGGAATRLQGEAAARHDSCALALTDWSRAIGDIQDSLQASVNGSYDSAENAEQYYQDSDREEISCNRHSSNVQDEIKKLNGRLASDIVQAQREVKAF